ncbi:MAG: SLC45 family MFS transporter [Asgard group archaeon]|nr:SLC45 family MFS transporter [Asgard group archaeon]
MVEMEDNDLGEYEEVFEEVEEDEFEESMLEPREIVFFEPRMKPNTPGKLKIGRTVLLSFAFLCALAALTYYNLAVPKILEELVPSSFVFLGFIQRKTFIGFLMTIDNILAITLQPFFASLSDRTESRFGRRIPYMIIGVAGSALFFGLAPIAQFLGYFVGMLFCYNIMMSFFRSPALALVPDYSEEKLRSSASGLQQLIANIGTIVAFGVPIIVGFAVPASPPGDEAAAAIRDVRILRSGFPIVSAVMIICLLILVFTVKETPTGKGFLRFSKEKINIDSMKFYIIQPNEDEIISENNNKRKKKKRDNAFIKIFKKDNRAILLLLFAVLFWFMGFAAIEANFSVLGTDFFEIPVDDVSLLGMVYPVSMIVASVPAGLVGKKIGRKKTIYICLGMLLLSLVIMASVVISLKNVIGFAIMMGFVGFFWMGVIVNTFPILWRLCPENEVSTFTGIYYTFNQTAAILGPILMGGIFDLANPGLGSNMYWSLFPFVIFCVVVALIFFIFVKGGEAIEESKAEYY